MKELTKTKNKPRQYHNFDKKQVAAIEALAVVLGNRSAAIRQLFPSLRSPRTTAYRAKQKSGQMQTEVFIDEQLQQIGVDAVNRLGEVVQSPDEKLALKASMYTIDHIRGQATKKSIALTGKLNIQNVLD